MTEQEILIIGSKGQLGKALRAYYSSAKAVDSDELDITDQRALNKYDFSGVKFVLNAAAYTNVDGAETDEGRRIAWQVNASGAANIAKMAQKNDLTLVHVSTDYVFDGSIANHKESEPFSPLSVYGASKAAGDTAVSLHTKHFILRTSWVIGEGKNFVRTMLELGKKGINPSVVSDQVGRLTFTNELVKAIDHLLENKSSYGTYNVTNDGESVSWADITRKIFDVAGYNNTVTNTTTNVYYEGKSNIAPRPLKSTLDLSKLKSTGFTPSDWEDYLVNYVKEEMEI